jgi:hypothetical protein
LEYLGLHNKPKAEVHPGHKLTGPKEEEEKKKKKKKLKTLTLYDFRVCFLHNTELFCESSCSDGNVRILLNAAVRTNHCRSQNDDMFRSYA